MEFAWRMWKHSMIKKGVLGIGREKKKEEKKKLYAYYATVCMFLSICINP